MLQKCKSLFILLDLEQFYDKLILVAPTQQGPRPLRKNWFSVEEDAVFSQL